ncbi:hypothetical protein Tco_1481768 [Tanacetum coccineum]
MGGIFIISAQSVYQLLPAAIYPDPPIDARHMCYQNLLRTYNAMNIPRTQRLEVPRGSLRLARRHDVARHMANTWQVNDHSTTTGPPVNDGQRRRSTAAVNGGQGRSTVEDHRRTTGQPWLTASQQGNGPGQVWSWAGS